MPGPSPSLNVRVPARIMVAIDALVDDTQTSRSDVVRALLDRALDRTHYDRAIEESLEPLITGVGLLLEVQKVALLNSCPDGRLDQARAFLRELGLLEPETAEAK